VSHRDIKPGNILVFDRRVFKLTDFGLSAVVGGAAKGHGGGGGAASNHGYQGPNEQGIAGTPCYMAPALYEYERAVAAYNNNVGLIGHVTRVARPEKPQTNYFVTDVFSLGLTLL
jgi:serine/threonine protein kinase